METGLIIAMVAVCAISVRLERKRMRKDAA